jgi:hypothetical protein
MAKDLKLVNDLIANKENSLDKPENYITPEIGLLSFERYY